MSVRIITDSASDISQELAKELNITVLPLKVRFGEEEFLDGVTLSNRQFYERLIETDEIPKTSQITPFEYRSNFEKAVKAGDQVVCFTLSSGVSGSYQSACVAAQEFEGDVFVVDTQQFCISEAIIAGTARLAEDPDDAVLNGEHRLERQKSSRKCSSRGDPSAQFEIFQRVENSEHMGVFLLRLDCCKDFGGTHSHVTHLHGALHNDSLRNAELLRVDDKYISLKLLCCDARALVGSGNS